MKRALLLGNTPKDLPFSYVTEPPYDALVIGSLTLGQLLVFQQEQVFSALAEGLPVYLYTPGLPQSPGNRALSASLSAAQRQLKNWGILFTDGRNRHLVTAEEAKALRRLGQCPSPEAILTPLAKEILER